jgi:hypothetical protein
MRKIQKGATAKAASFSKSSVSFDITPILDQSPLYLNIEIFLHEKDRFKFLMKKISKKTDEKAYPASMNPSPSTATTERARIGLEIFSGKMVSCWVLELSDKSSFLAIEILNFLPFLLTNGEEVRLLKIKLFLVTSISYPLFGLVTL